MVLIFYPHIYFAFQCVILEFSILLDELIPFFTSLRIKFANFEMIVHGKKFSLINGNIYK